jgi:hypothetical protein
LPGPALQEQAVPARAEVGGVPLHDLHNVVGERGEQHQPEAGLGVMEQRRRRHPPSLRGDLEHGPAPAQLFPAANPWRSW